DIRKIGADRRHRAARQWAESKRGPDDDAQGALRADHEGSEVEACDPLHAAVTEFKEAAIGEHDLETEDRLARHTVLRTQQATRVRGDVAADRRDGPARGVGGEPEAVLAHRVVEVAVQD